MESFRRYQRKCYVLDMHNVKYFESGLRIFIDEDPVNVIEITDWTIRQVYEWLGY